MSKMKFYTHRHTHTHTHTHTDQSRVSISVMEEAEQPEGRAAVTEELFNSHNGLCVCVCACARMRACVRACVCVWCLFLAPHQTDLICAEEAERQEMDSDVYPLIIFECNVPLYW